MTVTLTKLTATLAVDKSARVVTLTAGGGGGSSGNATQLQSRALAATAPTDGQAVVWNAAGSTWQPGTITAGVSSVTGTAPIVSSGGATPAISISAATTSAAGSMSAADKSKLDGIAAGATALTIGTTAGTAAAGNDARFSDITTAQNTANTAQSAINTHEADHANPHVVTAAQVGAAPTTHASQHATGGSDAIGQLAKVDSTGSYVPTANSVVSTSTATLSANVDYVPVTYNGTCTLTLTAPTTYPHVCQIVRTANGAGGSANSGSIALVPPTGASINGLSANATWTSASLASGGAGVTNGALQVVFRTSTIIEVQ